MTKDQFARLARHRKVKKSLAEYAAAVASVPAFARIGTRFLAQLALLDGAATRNAITSEGATIAKTTAGRALGSRLTKAANALYLLYKDENNLEEAAKMHRHPSDYTNMGDLALATAARDLAQRLTARQADLKTDYNIKAADVAAVVADAASFDGMLEDTQLAIDAGKIKGAASSTTLRALNAYLKDDFRAGLELLKDTQPEAYKALREASQVDDARYRKGKRTGGGLSASPTSPPSATDATN